MWYTRTSFFFPKFVWDFYSYLFLLYRLTAVLLSRWNTWHIHNSLSLGAFCFFRAVDVRVCDYLTVIKSFSAFILFFL